jgi:hypothetical protein
VREAVDTTTMIISFANMLEVARIRICPGEMMMFISLEDVTTRISPGGMIMRMSQSEMTMFVSP